jgi:hypothetical protein
MNTKSRIASVLNVDDNDQWEICDSLEEQGLYLVHHAQVCDLEKYGWMKGVIVDVNTSSVVCQSYGASITVSLSMNRPIVPVNNTFKFNSLDGQDISVFDDRCMWVRGHDGTLVRVWKHLSTNTVYISSHKRIQTNKANWGGSPTFSQLYKELNGPLDDLFPDDESTKCVYSFMIIHPSLQVGSRFQLKENETKLFYMGVHIMKDGISTNDPPVLSSINRPEEMSLKEVNSFLRNGYYPNPSIPRDPRMTNGEFVMLFEFTNSDKSVINRCIKVTSDAYDWRVRMRANDPDLCHLVFCLSAIKTRDMATRNGYRNYANRYLMIEFPESKDLPYLFCKSADDTFVMNHQRETAIASLVYATHPNQQQLVLDYFAEYMSFLNKCSEWIWRIWRDPSSVTHYNVIETMGGNYGTYTVKRIKNMIETSTSHCNKKGYFNGDVFDSNFKNSIKFLIEHEYGDSLYKMYQAYKNVL